MTLDSATSYGRSVPLNQDDVTQEPVDELDDQELASKATEAKPPKAGKRAKPKSAKKPRSPKKSKSGQPDVEVLHSLVAPLEEDQKPGEVRKILREKYEKELRRLHIELVKLQRTIVNDGLKVVVLPAAGEMVLLDRSWYNRAGVERVMGFCTDDQYKEFLRSCPEFERMLVRSGIRLIKYWFSVSEREQERRFRARLLDPTKRWKLSPMDLESRVRWVEYSKAKDMMFRYTDIKQAPWYVVRSDNKKRARLNCITHLLSMLPYDREMPPPNIELPPRTREIGYIRPPMDDQTFVPEVF
ncbi:MAG: polyphosphate kinase 2 [Proteobacteria bacterium]|nr:MAG: polyphosphate kinase 2 [Pseudomonadota bacterium]